MGSSTPQRLDLLNTEVLVQAMTDSEYQDWMLIDDQAGNHAGVNAAYETLRGINQRLEIEWKPRPRKWRSSRLGLGPCPPSWCPSRPARTRTKTARDLKPVYTAVNEDQARQRLADFDDKWGNRYPSIAGTGPDGHQRGAPGPSGRVRSAGSSSMVKAPAVWESRSSRARACETAHNRNSAPSALAARAAAATR